MSDMIEAALPMRSIYAEQAGWPRYLVSCATTVAIFCGVLWLAS